MGPGDFVIAFAESVYRDPPDVVASRLQYPFVLVTPWFDLMIVDTEELTGVLDDLRGSIRVAGIARLERHISSMVLDPLDMAIIGLNTKRFAGDGADRGEHHSIMVLETHNMQWRVRTLVIGEVYDSTPLSRILGRRFTTRLARSRNASRKRAGNRNRPDAGQSDTDTSDRLTDETDNT